MDLLFRLVCISSPALFVFVGGALSAAVPSLDKLGESLYPSAPWIAVSGSASRLMYFFFEVADFSQQRAAEVSILYRCLAPNRSSVLLTDSRLYVCLTICLYCPLSDTFSTLFFLSTSVLVFPDMVYFLLPFCLVCRLDVICD